MEFICLRLLKGKIFCTFFSIAELKEKPKAVDSFNLPYVPDSSPQKLQETKKMKNKILAYAE